MASAAVRFYFDYISTNAYLAWTQLPRLVERYGATIEPVAVLFAGLLEAHGQLGPAEILPKGMWMAKNNLRKALLLGVPLHRPAFHPFNPLLALRASSLALDAAKRHALISALFEAVWVRGLHVSEPAVVERSGDEIGVDGAALVVDAQRPETKALLRRQTDEAIARGVFGVPSMQLGDEIFWGYDDFPHLELALAGRDPLDSFEWDRWAGPPRPSAMRRRLRRDEGGGSS
jgi:2-hydroxychromene-2-carboxylate isomerase